MKMNNAKALSITLFCTLLILSAGYLGISQGGKLLLHNESTPEQTAYENTSSNVFYGKIEDDIALFPWNYYSEEAPTGFPQFGMFYIDKALELEMVFYNMIQLNTGIPWEQVSSYYSTKQIVENMKVSENDIGLQYYFFQDILEFEGKKYQIKIACDNWNILSVLCNEVRPEEIQRTDEWKQGKEVLTEVVEKNQEKLAAQMELIMKLNSVYLEIGDYMNLNTILTKTLNGILSGNEEEYWNKVKEKEEYVKEILGESLKEMDEAYLDQSHGNSATSGESLNETDGAYLADASRFSYQILERSDIILLLLQSDKINIGLYYDPIAVKFCGYNFL